MDGKSKSLFDRLGGVPAVRAVIDEFYKCLLDDERLSFFFRGTRMQVLKVR
jgi:truncated hemoglobin YjbI